MLYPLSYGGKCGPCIRVRGIACLRTHYTGCIDGPEDSQGCRSAGGASPAPTGGASAARKIRVAFIALASTANTSLLCLTAASRNMFGMARGDLGGACGGPLRAHPVKLRCNLDGPPCVLSVEGALPGLLGW